MSKLFQSSTATTILLVALIVTIAYQAGGGALLPGQPTTVVTVDLGAVLEKLDQRADAEASLNAMTSQLKVQNEHKTADIKKMQDEYAAMGESPQKQELFDSIQLAMLNHKAWYGFNSDKLDVEASLRMQDLYRSIKTEVARMASASGFDIVLVDDSQGELSTSGDSRLSREAQTRQQIAARRMLFVNKPVLDITDDLIARMNNAHKAAGPKEAPASN